MKRKPLYLSQQTTKQKFTTMKTLQLSENQLSIIKSAVLDKFAAETKTGNVPLLLDMSDILRFINKIE